MFISAEFIIDLADKNPAFDAFKKALVENGAEFSDSFMTNLLRIIQHMKPTTTESCKNDVDEASKNPLASKFPGLAIPNEKPPIFSSDEASSDEENDKKPKRVTSKDIFKVEKTKGSDDIVDQAMAELEALAPSKVVTKQESSKEEKKDDVKVKKRERSRSRDRKDRTKKRESSRDRRTRRSRSRHRSRSRDRRSRSRNRRSRSRDKRSRSHDRDRKRRSRSRHRRSKSRERYRRSRSKQRSKSRGRRSHSRERDEKSRFGDYGKKLRRKSPEVEISDDPEPGKVSIN